MMMMMDGGWWKTSEEVLIVATSLSSIIIVASIKNNRIDGLSRLVDLTNIFSSCRHVDVQIHPK